MPHRTLLIPLLAGLLFPVTARANPTGAPAPGEAAAADGVGGEPPQGIWELSSEHELGFQTQVVLAAGGLVVASDLRTRVVGVRPDSGLFVWSRELNGAQVGASVHRLGTGRGPEGDVALVVADGMRAFRADVGTRLWELGFTCEAGLCDQRLVYAGPVTGLESAQVGKVGWGGRPELAGDVLLLARGGSVQSELVRIDPRTGRAMWQRGAPVGHARTVVVAPSFIAVEEAVSPFGVTMIAPDDGKVLGRWERPALGGGAATGRSMAMMFAERDRLIAVDLRPGEGALANVVVVGPSGQVLTEREVPRPAALSGREQVPIGASAVPPGLGLFTPVPAERKAVLTLLRLEPPWTARSEVVSGAVTPRWASGGVWLLGRTDAGVVVNAIHGSRVDLPLRGFEAAPVFAEPLGEGRFVAIGAPGAGRGAAVMTLTRSQVQGVGAPDLEGQVVAAVPVGEELVVVTRPARAGAGDRLVRLGWVEWGVALERLRAAHERGADVSPLVARLSRFYPMATALGDSVRLAPVSPTGPLGQGRLSAQDQALVKALRDAWLSGDPAGTIEGMRALAEQAPERSTRRVALLDAFASLLLDLVLAPGATPRPEVAQGLVALARFSELEARRCTEPGCAVSGNTLTIHAALMALADEPLVGADLLLRARPAGEAAGPVREGRVELARRALHLLRKSAGPLRTETSRRMLVSGLRFFAHLDELAGDEAGRVSELLDLAGHDAEAMRELEQALARAEGQRAARKGAGPALCELACSAVVEVCGVPASRAAACRERCLKSGAVRLSTAARPGADPSWYCR